MQIKQIDIGVHLNFQQGIHQYPAFHPIQMALRQRWEEKIRGLREIEGAVLFYFPRGAMRQYIRRTNPHLNLDRLDRDEEMRITRYKRWLGDRLIIMEKNYPNHEELEALLDQRGFTLNPEEVTVNAYGEMRDACVPSVSITLVERLGISTEVLNIDPNLSLGGEALSIFRYWERKGVLNKSGRVKGNFNPERS